MSIDSLLRFGPYQFDATRGQLRRGSQIVKLTPKALALLRLFVTQPGQVVTKEELFRTVWPDTVVSDAALTACILELRQALRDNARTPRYIETVHRRGFRFIASLTATSPVPSAEFRVSSQEEANSQHPVDSGQEEESPKPVLSPSPLLRINSVEGTTGNITEQVERERQAAEPFLSSPSSLEPEACSLSQDSGLSTQYSPSSRFIGGFMVAAVLLLSATILTVQYLSRPSLSTQDSELRTQQALQALALPEKPSIAVLPFTNLSSDPEQEYWGMGLAQDLSNDFSKLSELTVIAGQSMLAYKGRPVSVQELSRDLRVQYVVKGSVRRMGEHLFINAQLIEGATGNQVWAERYDRPVQDLYAVQEEVRRKILVHVGMKLMPEEEARLQRLYTPSLEAYSALAHGIDLYLRTTPDANVQARQMCVQAIASDPAYAMAYTILGFTYVTGWLAQWDPDPEALNRAFVLAQQALALDDSFPIVHELLGAVYLWRDKNHELALAEFKRAVALGPNSFSAYTMLGTGLNYAGQPQEAIALREKPMRLSPQSLHYPFVLGHAYALAGQYAEAIVTFRYILSIFPQSVDAHLGLTAVFSALGREAESQVEAAEVLRLNPQFSLAGLRERMPYKDPAVAERVLVDLRKAGLK